MSKQRITVLGATGSIGESTLDVLLRHPERYEVYALTANRSVETLLKQAQQCRPKVLVLRDADAAQDLQARVEAECDWSPEVLSGEQALMDVASADGVDTVMAAIVGAAGLSATLAAVNAGKRVLLANKESLVMAGGLFMSAVARSGAVLLPIDSEHNALFQCLPDAAPDCLGRGGVRRLLLTGSGGPFRGRSRSQLNAVTPDEACAHPNWSMGRKISVDSATLMNKGLELIEACWLFHCQPQQIDVVIHPQSVIHSMVEYADGSVLAQMGNPDMRTPIAHALAWPERIESGVSSLDLIQQARLDFEAPDMANFPCLGLARAAAEQGGTAAAVLNAANEVAVEAFLAGELKFTDIAVLIDRIMQSSDFREPTDIDDVQNADRQARSDARRLLAGQFAA